MGCGKKVLITGSNGYIGRYVRNYLLDNSDYEVITLDVTPAIDDRCEHIQCDFLSKASDENLYAELKSPDTIIHLAWRDGFKHNSNAHLDNLSSHFQFLKNMIDSGVKSLSIMGTMHEIGYWEGEINADTPCKPLSLYGVAKNALRQAILAYSEDKDISLKWLRAYYITGDDTRSVSIFGKIVKMASEGKKTFPFTDGLNKYDFITVEELGKQIALASVQTKYNGIINCCTGTPVALKDRVEEFIRENNLNIRPEYGVFPTRKYDSPAVWGNADLINKIKIEAESGCKISSACS